MAEQSTPSNNFKLLSWNIDGLDRKDIVERTQAVINFISTNQPHCVYLQEVVEASQSMINKQLASSYDCYTATYPPSYYNAILTRKEALDHVGRLQSVGFATSKMGRHFLHLPVCFAGVDIHLITSHLESMKDYGAERKKQLLGIFEIMAKLQAANKTSIFAGDLNVRDFEMKHLKVPEKIADVWEACGSKEDQKFTWDTRENDNLSWRSRNKPRLRFDRAYLSPIDGRVKPHCFSLVGKERIPRRNRFPSDHWGMWMEFNVE